MKSIEKLRKVAEEQSSPVMCKLVRVYTDQDGILASNHGVREALAAAIDEIVVWHQGMEPQYSTVTALILTERWDFEQSCYDTDSRDVGDLSDFYENVSHVQPDSWERIIEDVRRRTSDYYCNNVPCDFNKMAAEMVERCKALAGAEQ